MASKALTFSHLARRWNGIGATMCLSFHIFSLDIRMFIVSFSRECICHERKITHCKMETTGCSFSSCFLNFLLSIELLESRISELNVRT